MRREVLGKSSQTLMPQKWEPSVQMGVEMPGRADVARKLGMDFAELGDFVHGGLIDFFLSVEAGAHGPFVEEMEERTGFVEADGLGVWQEIESDFRGDAAVEELIFRGPSVAHGAVVNF